MNAPKEIAENFRPEEISGRFFSAGSHLAVRCACQARNLQHRHLVGDGREMVSAEGIESALQRTFNKIQSNGRQFLAILVHVRQCERQVNGRWKPVASFEAGRHSFLSLKEIYGLIESRSSRKHEESGLRPILR
jgi:hypothetical protein